MGNQGLEIEEKVKKVLEIEFGKLTKQKRPTGKNRKEFDLVSDDRQLVIEVKSCKLGNETTKKSGYTTTRKPRLIAACAYLDKVDAKRKILVLTDKELYEQFKRDMDGDGLFPRVEIRCVPINNANDLRVVKSQTERVVKEQHSQKLVSGGYKSIRHLMEVLLGTNKKIEYVEAKAAVMKNFPTSAFNKSHISCYRNKIIKNGEFKHHKKF